MEIDLSFSGDRLSVYYSDQRDPKHGQKLVQQTTEGDFDSWGPVVNMVASDTYEDRPGMLIVTEVISPLSLLSPQHHILIRFSYPMVTTSWCLSTP